MHLGEILSPARRGSGEALTCVEVVRVKLSFSMVV